MAARPPAAASARTPMAFVQAILLAYARRGMDPAGALAKARIAPSGMGEGAGPGAAAHVSAAQFERLCAAAMRELDDEAPGWFSRPLAWGSYGMLARASAGAPTLGVAMQRWCRHHGLLTRDVTLHLTQSEGVAAVMLEEHRLLGPLREFALLSLLRNLHGLACWWVDAPLALHAAQFPFAAPPHADVYAALFGQPAQFGAARARLAFDARYLALALRRDASAVDALLRRALPLMVWPYRRDDLLAPRVRQALRQPHAAHTAETLAAQLALSPRTLHRRLHAEGSSVQALKDETRQARATELLLHSDLPLARVARAAGFQNDKSFIRAFRGWTGQTPQALREAARP